jgi:deazaflavin-dependent oxidoreductase (nitroreductase family)
MIQPGILERCSSWEVIPMGVKVTPEGARGSTRRAGFLQKRLLRVADAMYRLGIGRRMGSTRLLLLTTRGTRSGRLRTVPVAWFPDGVDAWLVVASFAGAAIHPAWYINMARNPDDVWIEVNDRKLKVTPTSLHGAEREERWRQITSQAPNIAGYEQKTDREIPVLRLTPAGAPTA